MATTIRDPIVAGAFYPGTSTALVSTLARLFGGAPPTAAGRLTAAMGLIVPHAGYIYSGQVAARGYEKLASRGRPDWVIILGTNHTGLGRPISLARAGVWHTPLGDTPIATDIADQLVERGFPVAEEAFRHEHSIEVQLPFVQYLFGLDIPFVPVCVMLPEFSTLATAGARLAEVVRGTNGAVIVSSDFTHYEPDGMARELDRGAIERILALDAPGFYHLVVRNRLSICGAGAITILLAAAAQLGWHRTELITYATSGDVTGDRTAVVGYAAVTLETSTDD